MDEMDGIFSVMSENNVTAQCDIFICLILSDQQFNTPKCFSLYHVWQKKSIKFFGINCFWGLLLLKMTGY